MLKQLKELSAKVDLKLTISTEENGEMKVTVFIDAKDGQKNALNLTPFIIQSEVDVIDQELEDQIIRLTSIVAPAIDRMNAVLKSIEEATEKVTPKEKPETASAKKTRLAKEKKDKIAADKIEVERLKAIELKKKPKPLFDKRGNPLPGSKLPDPAATVKAEAKVSGTLTDTTPEKKEGAIVKTGKVTFERIEKLKEIGLIASDDKLRLSHPSTDTVLIDELDKMKDLAFNILLATFKENIKVKLKIKELEQIGLKRSGDGIEVHNPYGKNIIIESLKGMSEEKFSHLLIDLKEQQTSIPNQAHESVNEEIAPNFNQASVDEMKAKENIVEEEISEEEQMQIDSMTLDVNLEEIESVAETIEVKKEIAQEEALAPSPTKEADRVADAPSPIQKQAPAPIMEVVKETPVVNEIEETEDDGFELTLETAQPTLEERFDGIIKKAIPYGIRTNSLKFEGQTTESLDQLENMLNKRIEQLNKIK